VEEVLSSALPIVPIDPRRRSDQVRRSRPGPEAPGAGV